MIEPSEFQIRTQVERVLEKYPTAKLLAFHCPQRLPRGSSHHPLPAGCYQVVEVDSPLDFYRQAAAAEQQQAKIIVLCREREWLSQDLQDRLPNGELIKLDAWEAIKRLFGAEEIEHSLKAKRDLAQWLLECDNQDFPKAPTGVLTEELAWDTFLKKRLGLNKECYDPYYLLDCLSKTVNQTSSYAPNLLEKPSGLGRSDTFGQSEASSGTRGPGLSPGAESGRAWLARHGGPEVDLLLELYFRTDARETLALCLVFEVLCLAPPDPEVHMALGSLSQLLNGRRLEITVGKKLAALFGKLINLSESSSWLPPIETRAKEMLSQLHSLPLARHSQILPEGWDYLLTTAVSDACEIDSKAHLLYSKRSDDLLVLQMARRVERFLNAPTRLPKDRLASWVADYQSNIAWLDQALHWLARPHPALAGHCQSLIAQAAPWRETYNQGFAQCLGRTPELANPPGKDGVFGVEHFIDHVLLPLLQDSRDDRLLLIVLDGCSQAALLDLLESLDSQNWSHFNHANTHRAILSALPSVTEVARTSLLSGKLSQGNAGDELKSFSCHPGLVQACGPHYGPRLFHKKSVDEAVQVAGRRDHKLVAVVLNAIDDTLAKDEQLRLNWSLELIAPLRPLLEAARSSQRRVLLVSDHGHVLDPNDGRKIATPAGAARCQPLDETISGTYPAVSGGNRWRPSSGQPVDLPAIEFSGGRLQLAERAQLLYSDALRFGPRKRGYHGGCSPAEMVCALALIGQPGQEIPNWVEARRRPPQWWTADTNSGDAQSKETLFEHLLADTIFKAPVFEQRVKLGILPRLAEVINLLESGQPLARIDLAAKLQMTSPQLQLRLPQWERWLNLDGRLLLRSDSRVVWLDLDAVNRVLA